VAFPRLSDAELRRSLAIFRRHWGNRRAVAAELGTTYGSVSTRINQVRARFPKEMAVIERPAPKGARQNHVVANAHAVRRLRETADRLRLIEAELREERRHRSLLEAQLKRAGGAKPPPKLSPRPRIGREDLIRVVIPDSHGSFIDPEAAGAFLADLKLLAPHEIVMLGDHVDCGGFLAQHHTLGYVAEASYTYEDDLKACGAFLDAIQAAAPRASIDYLEGNHEARVERWCLTESLRSQKDGEFLRSVLAPEVLLKLKDRGIRYHRRSVMADGIPIPGTIRRGKCYFTHEAIGGRHAAGAMVRKYGAPVVFGHIHRQQADLVRTVNSGVIGAWSPGCLSRLQPLWMHTDLTDWAHGYGVQFVAKSGQFLHLQVPIMAGGISLLPKLG